MTPRLSGCVTVFQISEMGLVRIIREHSLTLYQFLLQSSLGGRNNMFVFCFGKGISSH